MSPLDVALLAVAGLVGSAVNAVAGGGSLITFPALLATGLSPLAANTTNTLGLLPGYVGGSLAYREELRDQAPRLRTLVPAAVVGALLGAAVLLTTSEAAFEAVVPFLVLGAVGLLAVQPRLSAALRQRHGRDRPVALHAAVVVAGAYASYFGAGVGVLLLAVLGLLLADGLQRLNALKGVLSLACAVVGSVVFVLLAPVDLAAAGVLAVTSLVGGRLGGGLARRLPERVLRTAVLVLGVAVAVALLR